MRQAILAFMLVGIALAACRSEQPPPLPEPTGPEVDFVPPAGGSRFVFNDGHIYEVIATQGKRIQTQNGFLFGGLFLAGSLGANSAPGRDLNAQLSRVWPLQVGKFVQARSSEWDLTIRVLREEQLDVASRHLRSFVVELHGLSHSSWNSSDFTATTWYAPDLSFPVRIKNDVIRGTGLGYSSPMDVTLLRATNVAEYGSIVADGKSPRYPPGKTIGKLEYAPPVAGTQFRFTDGRLFEVLGIEGKTVHIAPTTYLASGFLLCCVLSPTAPQMQELREKIDAVWPLEVGKTLEFGVGYKQYGFSWDFSVKVLREEDLKTDLGTLHTFVIEVHERGRTVNISEAVVTYWYAPEISFPARIKSEIVRGFGGSTDITVLRVQQPSEG